MFGALIGYPLIFVLGYLLHLQIKKPTHGLETLILSFLLGTANVIFVLLIFGILGHLDLGVYSLAVEVFCLVFLLGRKASLSKLKFHNIYVNGKWSDVFFILLIATGLALRFGLLWSYIPNTAWDGLKFYLPWTKQLFEQNAIPNFDFTFNAGEPFGHSISFVVIGYLLYFLNNGVNEVMVYTISPVFSLMTTLMVYILVRKLLNSNKLGYIAGAIYVFIPLNLFVDAMPYVEAMLAFFTLAFFLYIDYPSLAAVSASLATLTKYSGFVLLLLIIGYLLWRRNMKALLHCILFIFLFTAPWYFRNVILYHNPLPFQALPLKIFENPPKAFDVLEQYGSQMHLFDPISSLLSFFSLSDLLSTLSRFVVLVYAFYAIAQRKKIAFYMVSFLTFLFVLILSSERDPRYLIPFYPLLLVAFMDMILSTEMEIKSSWQRILIETLIAFFAMVVLNGSVVLYLLQVHVLIALLILGSVTLLLMWRFRRSPMRVGISMKYVFAGGLLGLTVFSCLAQSYRPFAVAEQQYPDWQCGLVDLISYIQSVPDRWKCHFLLIEDPGIRYYANLNSYELTDPYGAIKLSDLFDTPRVQAVFFGAESRRLYSQGILQIGSDYTNVNNLEAMINSITLQFSDLVVSEDYLLVMRYKGAGYIRNSSILPASEKAWGTFTQEFNIKSPRFILTITKNSMLMLRFLLLIPLKLFSASYVNWLRNALESHDIKYIVTSEALSNVWVYCYYSIFSFLYLQVSSGYFQKLYTSDYWELYRVE
jgi:hypothetical protein